MDIQKLLEQEIELELKITKDIDELDLSVRSKEAIRERLYCKLRQERYAEELERY